MGIYTPSADIVVDGHRVESDSSFCCLSSTTHSSGSCRPDVMCRIRNAATAIDSLSRVWSRGCLTVTTKLRIYQTCIMSVLLYGAETWTLLAADLSRLQAFLSTCAASDASQGGGGRTESLTSPSHFFSASLVHLLDTRRASLFGHVARLGEKMPAHGTLRLAVDNCLGAAPLPAWRRPRSRPHSKWLGPFL